jgi:glycosyltransferase involved in cell wall biosynthesis
MKILTIHPNNYVDGCAAYRFWIPSRYLNRNGVESSYVHMNRVETFNINYFDIVVLERILAHSPLVKMKKLVYDIDDDVGDKQRKLLTREQFKIYREIIRKSDAITTSTEYLKSQLEKHTSKPIFVCPNMMDLEIFDACEKQPSDNISIGVVGGPSHFNDWRVLARPIEAILSENSNVILYVIGYSPGYLTEIANKFYNRVVTFNRFVPYPVYVNVIKQIDIRLSPLETDKSFNYSKSPIAALEMMACKNISIAQDINVYNEVISHGENGFLCNDENDWYKVVTQVINDENLRNKVKSSGRLYVEQNYDAKIRVHDWVESYQQIMRL